MHPTGLSSQERRAIRRELDERAKRRGFLARADLYAAADKLRLRIDDIDNLIRHDERQRADKIGRGQTKGA